ncbi:Biogenesis of lysosome-related organelles complex 1 subunit KXD1 [Colletotrichum orbiculare MAFF 240422]|uniref:Biogenesis of lysosome-related organelles complex 1 subunit KXD1 n=1 Tax=Colletotrichum orbiculare (strain 104-T / ATCC 96160 / CBS 514.97 / LARS 414 / MAFF 240422) TaxID=1213857 RepID=A0A484FI35_COLOR|nr:Biogenesis of lysosome-related organelles complex 1 subunit KXD1 [Colletotrichum orbiculare MAFF 240422]
MSTHYNAYSLPMPIHNHKADTRWPTRATPVATAATLRDRFAQTFDPIPLDRNIAVQAQTSGKLNAKHRELLELQKKAQARLAKTRERFNEGYRDAQDVRADLEWTQKKVTSLKSKTSRKHNKEYNKARARYPSPEF